MQCCLCCPLVFCAIFAVLPFFYFCTVCGPVLHPCQLTTRFWIFLKPPFLLHQSVFYTKPMNPLTETALKTAFQTGVGGGGGTPYDSLYGEAPPERGIFFRLQVYERVGNSLVEVYKRVGKSVVWVCKRAQGLTENNNNKNILDDRFVKLTINDHRSIV